MKGSGVYLDMSGVYLDMSGATSKCRMSVTQSDVCYIIGCKCEA